jgi:HPt (histidine-containing phosphotransfer) domain-containing protein
MVICMTLLECYRKLGGDYRNAVTRLMNDKLVQKFLFKFLDDLSYNTLAKAFNAGNYDEAFRASHTLKGISQNLSFTSLYKSSEKLTEALRSKDTEAAAEHFEQVTADYEKAIATIKEYKAEL